MPIRPLFRVAATLLLLTALAVPTSARSPRLEQSVQPLQFEGDTFCTAFSINEAEGLWASAKHCAVFVLEKKLPVTIGGVWAMPVYLAPMDDISVWQSAKHAPALRLADKAPKVGDLVRIEGYPMGLFRLIESRGFVAARQEPTDNGVSDVLDIAVYGGSSGSPVLNSQDEVVGLLWGGWPGTGFALSVPWETVLKLIGTRFQQQ